MAKKDIVTISDITQFGVVLSRSIRSRLKWSKKLRGTVKLHPATRSGDSVSTSITVAEGNDDLTAMAMAYEKGSGLYGPARRKYPIRPVSKKALWFYMENPAPHIPIYIKPDGGIGVTLPKVMHPGVKPRPFISSAITDTLKKATDELRVSVVKNVREMIRLEFKEIK